MRRPITLWLSSRGSVTTKSPSRLGRSAQAGRVVTLPRHDFFMPFVKGHPYGKRFQKGHTLGFQKGNTLGKGKTSNRNWKLPQPLISPNHPEFIALWWSRNNYGYYYHRFKQDDGTWKKKLLHVLIMEKNLNALGLEPLNGRDVDHRDHDKRNNLDGNLRPATRSQNLGNRKFDPEHPFRGTWLKRGKWHGRFQQNYIVHRVGPYDTQLEAFNEIASKRKELGCFDSSPEITSP